jgi:hypothetical protein
MHHQRYSVYWHLCSEEERAKLAAAEAKRKADEARIVDEVNPGMQQSETDHNFQGERTNTGDFRNRKWRDSQDRFSYEMNDSDNAFTYGGPRIPALQATNAFIPLPNVVNEWQRLSVDLKYFLTSASAPASATPTTSRASPTSTPSTPTVPWASPKPRASRASTTWAA